MLRRMIVQPTSITVATYHFIHKLIFHQPFALINLSISFYLFFLVFNFLFICVRSLQMKTVFFTFVSHVLNIFSSKHVGTIYVTLPYRNHYIVRNEVKYIRFSFMSTYFMQNWGHITITTWSVMLFVCPCYQIPYTVALDGPYSAQSNGTLN